LSAFDSSETEYSGRLGAVSAEISGIHGAA
jgi:hypothetical protein